MRVLSRTEMTCMYVWGRKLWTWSCTSNSPMVLLKYVASMFSTKITTNYLPLFFNPNQYAYASHIYLPTHALLFSSLLMNFQSFDFMVAWWSVKNADFRWGPGNLVGGKTESPTIIAPLTVRHGFNLFSMADVLTLPCLLYFFYMSFWAQQPRYIVWFMVI